MQSCQDEANEMGNKKQKKFNFETSTPKTYRVNQDIIDSDHVSPIMKGDGLNCV